MGSKNLNDSDSSQAEAIIGVRKRLKGLVGTLLGSVEEVTEIPLSTASKKKAAVSVVNKPTFKREVVRHDDICSIESTMSQITEVSESDYVVSDVQATQPDAISELYSEIDEVFSEIAPMEEYSSAAKPVSEVPVEIIEECKDIVDERSLGPSEVIVSDVEIDAPYTDDIETVVKAEAEEEIITETPVVADVEEVFAEASVDNNDAETPVVEEVVAEAEEEIITETPVVADVEEVFAEASAAETSSSESVDNSFVDEVEVSDEGEEIQEDPVAEDYDFIKDSIPVIPQAVATSSAAVKMSSGHVFDFDVWDDDEISVTEEAPVETVDEAEEIIAESISEEPVVEADTAEVTVIVAEESPVIEESIQNATEKTIETVSEVKGEEVLFESPAESYEPNFVLIDEGMTDEEAVIESAGVSEKVDYSPNFILIDVPATAEDAVEEIAVDEISEVVCELPECDDSVELSAVDKVEAAVPLVEVIVSEPIIEDHVESAAESIVEEQATKAEDPAETAFYAELVEDVSLEFIVNDIMPALVPEVYEEAKAEPDYVIASIEPEVVCETILTVPQEPVIEAVSEPVVTIVEDMNVEVAADLVSEAIIEEADSSEEMFFADIIEDITADCIVNEVMVAFDKESAFYADLVEDITVDCIVNEVMASFEEESKFVPEYVITTIEPEVICETNFTVEEPVVEAKFVPEYVITTIEPEVVCETNFTVDEPVVEKIVDEPIIEASAEEMIAEVCEPVVDAIATAESAVAKATSFSFGFAASSNKSPGVTGFKFVLGTPELSEEVEEDNEAVEDDEMVSHSVSKEAVFVAPAIKGQSIFL